MAYSELPWRPFLGHQAWSWTTLRTGNVFITFTNVFFYFCHVCFTLLTVFYIYNWQRSANSCWRYVTSVSTRRRLLARRYARDNITTLADVCLCWSVQIKYLGCCFRGKQCAVYPITPVLLADFMAHLMTFLNVMGRPNSRNEMSALYLIQTYDRPTIWYEMLF